MPLTKLSPIMFLIVALTPIVVIPTALLTNLDKLKTLPDTAAIAISILASITVMGWSVYIATISNKKQDEVQKASTHFATHHSITIGSIIVALALCIPAVHDAIINTANSIALHLKGTTKGAPLIAFVGGFAALSIAQGLSAVVLSNLWWRSKS